MLSGVVNHLPGFLGLALSRGFPGLLSSFIKVPMLPVFSRAVMHFPGLLDAVAILNKVVVSAVLCYPEWK